MRITSRQSTTYNRRNAIIAATDTGYLFPCSRLNSPPYLGRVPTNSRISGMQLANTACTIEQLLKNMHIIWFTWEFLACSVHANTIWRQNNFMIITSLKLVKITFYCLKHRLSIPPDLQLKNNEHDVELSVCCNSTLFHFFYFKIRNTYVVLFKI